MKNWKNLKRILAVLMMALVMVSFMPTMSVFADQVDPAKDAATETQEADADAAPATGAEEGETAKDAEADAAAGEEAEANAEEAEEASEEASKSEPKDIEVLVSISQGGEIVEGKDGQKVILVPVTLTGKDSYTLDDAFKAAHEALNKDGSAAYATEETQWGLGVSKLWGVENGGNYGYQVNGGTVMVMGPGQEISDGDHIDAYVLVNNYPDTEAYAVLTPDLSVVDAGEVVELVLTSASYDENFNMVFSPVEGAQIKIDGILMSGLTDADGKVIFKLSQEGEHTVEASKNKELDGKTVPAITAAAAKVFVKTADGAGAVEPAATNTGTTTKPAANAVPKTGDEQNIMLYVILFLSALVITVKVKRTN